MADCASDQAERVWKALVVVLRFDDEEGFSMTMKDSITVMDCMTRKDSITKKDSITRERIPSHDESSSCLC